MVTIHHYSMSGACLHPAGRVILHAHSGDTCSQDLALGVHRCELSSTAWWETANPGIAELALSCCHARVYLQHCFTWFCYAQANKKHLQIYHGSSPFTLKNEASIWSPCAPAPVTHTAVLPNLANDGRESIWKDFGEKGGSSLVIRPGLTTNL